MTPDDLTTITDLSRAIFAAVAAGGGGWVVALSIALYGLIQVIKLSFVQRMLAKVWPKLAWDTWAKPVQLVFVVGVTFAGAFAFACADGLQWQVDLMFALKAAGKIALSAMGINAGVDALTKKPTNPT